MKKIVLSGIKATGDIHIGNYFGAIRQFVVLQEEHECLFFVANYHSLTGNVTPDGLKEDTLSIVSAYLASGIDPQKSKIFLQSDVPEVTELAWIFNTITTVPYLERAHAFKAAEANKSEINVGLFDYPILMASDILIQDADLVPVGADQKQHIEIARDTGEKFNRLFGETFKIPEPLILDEVKTVPGTDGRKMSKSYGNTIPLFAEKEELTKIVMSMPTDSKGVDEPKDPDNCNILAIHRLVGDKKELAELEDRYRKGGIGYKESKEALINSLERFISPMRERRAKIKDSDILAVLADGGKEASKRARNKMEAVRRKVGILTTTIS